MFKGLASVIRRLAGLAVLIVVAWAGWRWGDAVFPELAARLSLSAEPASPVEAGPEPSEELARETTESVERFFSKPRGELRLSGPELTSLLRYRRADLLPPGFDLPTVEIADGRASISVDVRVAEYPNLPDLGPVGDMLPDVVRLELDGSVMGFGSSEAAFVVQRVQVAGVPLPGRVVPQILTALGRTPRPGLPDEAIAVPLPEGVESTHLLADRLVLVAED